jgi:hypothetical protein
MSNRSIQDQLGHEFVWFFGVVEDRIDPLKLGRVRVRCYGWHTNDKEKLPTKNLPWAQCVQDITSGSMSGIGRSPTGIVEGTWVVGFFLDAKKAQKPMVLGTLAGIPQTLPDSTKGFNDPEGAYPKIIDEPDVSRLARNEQTQNTIVQTKKNSRDTEIPVANSASTWNEPFNPYNARYPYNHVWQTESGHVVELDDSDGSERVHIYHRTGTFIEIDSNGTKVSKTIGDQYEILERNGYVHIKGNVNVTIDGDANLYVKNNLNLDVDGDMNIKVRNDFNMDVSGNTHISTRESMNMIANTVAIETLNGPINQYVKGGDYNVYTDKEVNIKSDGDNNMDADNMYWQSNKADTASKSTLAKAPDRVIASPVVLSPLIELNRDDLFAIYYDDEEAVQSTPPTGYIEEFVAAGAGTQEQLDTVAPTSGATVDETETAAGTATNTQRDQTLTNRDDFPDSLQLSTNYNLGQLSSRAVVSKYKVRPQVGLSSAEIVQNLKGVAENILEPILAKYPDMIVTSAFRVGKTRSQHFRGQAVDIQFRNASKKEYYERAKIIKNLVPYDQFLLEFKNTGTGLPWIHISFSFDSNRGQVLTFFNHKVASSGLIQLA